jgi:hypothetical protein
MQGRRLACRLGPPRELPGSVLGDDRLGIGHRDDHGAVHPEEGAPRIARTDIKLPTVEEMLDEEHVQKM